jgi:hypothetical protein
MRRLRMLWTKVRGQAAQRREDEVLNIQCNARAEYDPATGAGVDRHASNQRIAFLHARRFILRV